VAIFSEIAHQIAKDSVHHRAVGAPFIPAETQAYIALWLEVVFGILLIAIGNGVFQSKRRAITFALGIAALSMTGVLYIALVGVAMSFYAGLRLWGNVGPRPV